MNVSQDRSSCRQQPKSNIKRGRFIVIEGLEGAGKSTAVEGLCRWLDDQNIPYVQTREPGGTHIGECLRSLLKVGLNHEKVTAQGELLLIYAARAQLIEQVIQPALAAGKWVIADRFDLSSYAYQGGGRQLSLSFIDSLSEFCLNGLKPDRLYYLHIRPEEGLIRVRQRGALDRFESESQAFFMRVYEMYQQQLSKVSYARQIDAHQSAATVLGAITSDLMDWVDTERLVKTDL